MLKKERLCADPLTPLEEGVIQGSGHIINSHELSTRKSATD
jgi:hypothetical protein